MILTGKCKEDFLKWKVDNKNLSTIEVLDFKHFSKTSQNALIIEFFDSVGIDVNAIKYNKHYFQPYCNHLLHEKYKSRQEAITEAIKKANEIYNSL